MKISKRSTALQGAALLAIASIALPAAADNGPNLIVNGGFEQTTLTMTGPITATDIPGWSSTSAYNELYFPGTSDEIGVGYPSWWQWLWGPNNVSQNGLPATSPSGGNFVAIDADPTIGEVGELKQQVSGLTPGTDYTLSFDYAAAQFTTRLGPTTNYFAVSMGDQTHDTPTLVIASEGFSGWYRAAMTFTATSTSETLAFLAQGTPIGYPPASLLDGVSLVANQSAPVTTPVPEPANAALLGLGLVCFGYVAHRKRRME